MMREPNLFNPPDNRHKAWVDDLNDIFRQAILSSTSDVHFQYMGSICRVRFRISGKLRTVVEVSKDEADYWDRLIRSRARIPTSERSEPVDGRIRLVYEENDDIGKTCDIRLNMSPTISGQLIVGRLLMQNENRKGIADILMPAPVRAAITSIVNEPQGLFLVSGPTGSGKTTTLYSIVNELDMESSNIITIEQPVEYQIPGLNQINVDGIHMTFAKALRAVVREDPDVILVGEIRDSETAKIAVEAANTGHLVLATVHANNSAMAITRLVDLGVDPGTLAAALRAVTAQRLVRSFSEQAQVTWEPASEIELAWLRHHNLTPSIGGYPRVTASGDYSGRIPLIEMIVIDEHVRRSIEHGPAAIFEAAARQPSFELLSEAGVRLVEQGWTSLEQVRNVVSNGDAHKLRIRRLGDVLVAQGKIQRRELAVVVEEQCRLRAEEGRLVPLGVLLVAHGLVSEEDVFDAMGYSCGAPALLDQLVDQGVVPQASQAMALQEWESTRGLSMWAALAEHGVKKEVIYAATRRAA